ncbi:MAG: hypothetical protein AB1659_02520 [Thermodesulfobacteriota bacterium]
MKNRTCPKHIRVANAITALFEQGHKFKSRNTTMETMMMFKRRVPGIGLHRVCEEIALIDRIENRFPDLFFAEELKPPVLEKPL